MRYLLDTHVAVWFVEGDRRLLKSVAETLSRASAEPLVSYASFWEIAVKRALGKVRIDLEAFRDELVAQKIALLPITLEHAMLAGDLDPHHRDPFDRMLITQAKADSLTIVTHDRQFEAYAVSTMWT
ncbi:MAG: type II toxin-antitoxin system VapC family toxin [Alphaproteobacteria bacterium]|nr:type II toxin-antitoxin system VapC family toxin [Alphaproteobacteria bacterium]